MRKLFKNLTAIGLSVTMVVGTASMASAAVAKGTDVSNGKAWTSYSIHTREDNGSWEDKLIGAGQIKRIHTRVMVKMQRLQHRHQAVLQ